MIISPFLKGCSSKHRRKPFFGNVKIVADSSLRKLMRASARGLIPDERQQVIDTAENSAHRRLTGASA